MIYFDSSALVKLIKTEPESDALREWRSSQITASFATSRLSSVEISRMLTRSGCSPTQVEQTVAGALHGVFLMDVTARILARAGTFTMNRLGSLDAIHLATAESSTARLLGFVTYDKELAAAASAIGMNVFAPS